MARNGAGAYTVVNTFTPGTPITASSHNANWSDMGAEMTNSLAADGQTTMTGAIKGANGTASAPGYSFASDLNTGMFRVSADVLGLAVGGTSILQVSSTGVSVTGSITSSAQSLYPDGTVLLPQYSFTADPNSGMYRIGDDNVGVAVNGAKVLDVSTTGLNVVGTILQNGGALAQAAYATGMINGTIVESHSGNAVTFALKTRAGADPSASDPVVFLFRNATAATGDYTIIQAQAAMSLVITSGSTMGFASGVAGRLWLVMFNDGGTLRMGAINCLSGTNIYPMGQFPIASSTAEGGSGGADSAQVFYTGAAVTSKAYVPIAYASYESGVATAGSWAASPTRLQLYGPGVPLPGQVIQSVGADGSSATTSGSTALPIDDTIPQISEGVEVITQAITPTSTANVLTMGIDLEVGMAVGGILGAALFQDSTAGALYAGGLFENANGTCTRFVGRYAMKAGIATSTTFRVRVGTAGGATVKLNSNDGTNRVFGGVALSYLVVTELMA